MDTILDRRFHIARFQFDLGQTVYLRTDEDQLPRIVKAYRVSQGPHEYELAQGVNVSLHTADEIATKPNFDLLLGEHDDEELI
jgi:hypothetical protein